MKREVRAIIKDAMGGATDNLYRCELACGANDPSKEWGQSGQTLNEIRQGYSNRVDHFNKCLKWLEKQGE